MRDCARPEKGFTLIELLVVIAIIALLVSILMPSLSKAKDLAKDVVCQSNLRNVGFGIFLYAQDYDDQLPVTTHFGSPNPWYWLHWAHRIGRIEDSNSTLPSYIVYGDFSSAAVPQETLLDICREGYVDFHYNEDGEGPAEDLDVSYSREGTFKCPTYWDKVFEKDDIQTVPRQYSMNEHLSPIVGVPKPGDSEPAHECVRLTDIERSFVMFGDCGVKPASQSRPHPAVLWFIFDSSAGTEEPTYTLEHLLKGGPWPWQEEYYWTPGWWFDWEGHSGDRSNLYYTDGHVAVETKLQTEHFNP